MKVRKGGLILLALLIAPLNLAGAMDAPETVQLDTMTNLFDPVTFDHNAHVDLTDGDCAVCHHHTTGTPIANPRCIPCHKNSGEADVVACSDCHPSNPFDAEYLKKIDSEPLLHHIDKIGLKAAYHRKCLGCHRKMDAPTGCQDCHARNDTGDAFYHSGKYAPETGKEHNESED